MLSRQDKLFSLILLGILVVGTLSAISFPFTTHAQNDTDYFYEPSSAWDTNEAENPNVPDQSSDVSTNDEMTADFNQASGDAEGVSNSPVNTDSNTSQANGRINSDPIADAGVNLEVDENSNVVLDGRGSIDRDGEISSYSWIQVDGSPT
jgi:hypothetical protein